MWLPFFERKSLRPCSVSQQDRASMRPSVSIIVNDPGRLLLALTALSQCPLHDYPSQSILRAGIRSVKGESKYEREGRVVSPFSGFPASRRLTVSKFVNSGLFLLTGRHFFKPKTSQYGNSRPFTLAASALPWEKSVLQSLHIRDAFRGRCAWFRNFPITHRIESY